MRSPKGNRISILTRDKSHDCSLCHIKISTTCFLVQTAADVTRLKKATYFEMLIKTLNIVLTNHGRADVDISNTEQTFNDVSILVDVNNEQCSQHDGCISCAILPSDVTNSSVKQSFNYTHITVGHSKMKNCVHLQIQQIRQSHTTSVTCHRVPQTSQC
jgi:hypothetical protein